MVTNPRVELDEVGCAAVVLSATDVLEVSPGPSGTVVGAFETVTSTVDGALEMEPGPSGGFDIVVLLTLALLSMIE